MRPGIDREFKRIEDRAVDEAIAVQEESGVDVVSDGELRRFGFIGSLIEIVDGIGPAAGERLSREAGARACGARRRRGGLPQEGAVGGGTGMVCHGFKGGIGTASRTLPADAGRIHGRRARAVQLRLAPRPADRRRAGRRGDSGSRRLHRQQRSAAADSPAPALRRARRRRATRTTRRSRARSSSSSRPMRRCCRISSSGSRHASRSASDDRAGSAATAPATSSSRSPPRIRVPGSTTSR